MEKVFSSSHSATWTRIEGQIDLALLHLWTDDVNGAPCQHVRYTLRASNETVDCYQLLGGTRGPSTSPQKRRTCKERWTVVDTAAACVAKQNKRSGVQAEMAHFPPSVHWLSCYDKPVRGLSFPRCRVPSLGHMSLLNKCSRERSGVREGVSENGSCWAASNYCSWPKCIDYGCGWEAELLYAGTILWVFGDDKSKADPDVPKRHSLLHYGFNRVCASFFILIFIY